MLPASGVVNAALAARRDPPGPSNRNITAARFPPGEFGANTSDSVASSNTTHRSGSVPARSSVASPLDVALTAGTNLVHPHQ